MVPSGQGQVKTVVTPLAVGVQTRGYRLQSEGLMPVFCLNRREK